MIQIRIAFILTLLAATNAATWYLTHQSGQNRLYEVQLQTAAVTSDELLRLRDLAERRLKIINKSQVKHDEDQIYIDQLADNLKQLQVNGICSGAVQAGSGATASQDAGSWVFSEGVDSNFARLQFRASELFRQCDQINIDAIRANSQGVGIMPMR